MLDGYLYSDLASQTHVILEAKAKSREEHAPNVFWQEAAELVAALGTPTPKGLSWTRPTGPIDPHNIAHEQLPIGDEAGVQGRFGQQVGHVMTAVFGSQGLDIAFGDLKAVTDTYPRTPDAVIMNGRRAGQPQVKAVGELKSPWMTQHQLFRNPTVQNARRKKRFRRQIGQLARYMQELGVEYGFYSTYNQHIFLKQEIVDGSWVLRYSPVVSDIASDITYQPFFISILHITITMYLTYLPFPADLIPRCCDAPPPMKSCLVSRQCFFSLGVQSYSHG
ncbi:uncharacterized protein N7515_001044 [Penicillium bovifimosum]|uniref:Uncharacterized protein n=1 Tax=Penicillium bovifimosum TaxID=126998 RepID=A0A9W9HGH9_9EURO|nr:uncharacterized protein N7515_001044 [Penicillium bovifimosum]KAJ5146480.1 hypothetical protein N7515_001044 [Penicillium bovifimosum]